MNNLAICLLATGKTDQAGALLARILAAQPANAAAHANLGILLYQNGRTEEAIPHLKEAIRLDPNNQPARQLLEQLNAGTGGR
jgi:rhomboid protease GluP